MKLTAANKLRVDLVAAQNDLMALAARKVFSGISDLSDRERWMSAPFLGVDGLVKTGQSWVREGLLTATVIMPPSAGQALKLMVDALTKGSPVQEKNWLPPESFPPLGDLKPAGMLPS